MVPIYPRKMASVMFGEQDDWFPERADPNKLLRNKNPPRTPHTRGSVVTATVPVTLAQVVERVLLRSSEYQRWQHMTFRDVDSTKSNHFIRLFGYLGHHLRWATLSPVSSRMDA